MSFVRRFLLLTLPLIALAACAEAPPPVAKPKAPPVSDQAAAENYLTSAALAQIALAPPAGSIDRAEPHLKALRAYAADKKKTKPVELTVLAMTYRADAKEDEQHTLVVAVPPKAEPAQFEELESVLKELSGTTYMLQDLHVRALKFMRPAPAAPIGDDATSLRRQLERQQKQVMAGARPLLPLEEAKLQMKLAQIFLNHRSRDAAYLALENAKNALARAADDKPVQADVTTLSQEAELLENTLNREMPYTL